MRRRDFGTLGLIWIVLGCGGGGGGDSGTPGASQGKGELRLSLAERIDSNPPSSLVRVSFFIEDSAGRPLPGLLAGDFTILENGVANSAFESSKRISLDERDFTTYTLLLLDLSDSIRRSGALPSLVEAAKTLVDIVFDSSGSSAHRIAVYWFDGGAEIQNALGSTVFTADKDLIKNAIDNLPASLDRSTNFFGAVIAGIKVLDAALKEGATQIARGNLVVFTDGRDNANRARLIDAQRVVFGRVPVPGAPDSQNDSKPLRSFTIGLGGEIDVDVLKSIGRTGFRQAAQIGELQETFEGIASRIRDEANSFYLLEYCSPKRAGTHRLTVEALSETRIGSITTEFDASGFSAECPIDFVEFGVESIGGAGDDEPSTIAIDSARRRVIGGTFTEEVDLGAAVLTTAGLRSGYVVRLFPETERPRRVDWIAQFGTAPDSDVIVHDVLTLVAPSSESADGDSTIVVGTFAGTLSVRDRAGVDHIGTSGGGRASFVARLDGRGRVAWTRFIANATSIELVSIASGELPAAAAGGDPTRFIALAGGFDGNARFDPAPAIDSAGGRDALIVRIDLDGAVEWAVALGSEGDDEARSVAVSPAGNILIAGTLSGPIGPPDALVGQSTAYPAAFVAQFDARRARQWITTLGRPDALLIEGPSRSAAIAVDRFGNVYVAGAFRGRLVSGTPLPTGSSGADDAFVARLLDGGQPNWIVGFGGSGDDAMHALELDPNDDVAVLASFEGTAALPSAGLSLSSAGGKDVAFIRLAGARGRHIFTSVFGGPSTDEGRGIAFDVAGEGDVHLTGFFEGSASFFDVPLATNDGAREGFLLRLR
jgi:hypothetical protein